MNSAEKIHIIIVEPGRLARKAEMDNTMAAGQAVVGGRALVLHPRRNASICIVINENGKALGLEGNRVIPECDTIAYGPFFVCGCERDQFCSLTKEQTDQYLFRFEGVEYIFEFPERLLVFSRTKLENETEEEFLRESIKAAARWRAQHGKDKPLRMERRHKKKRGGPSR